MPDWLDPLLIESLRLGPLATALGGLIGLERELSGKPAGLRTNILICVGATLLMDISLTVARSGIGTVADPGRIAAQVVSGIGFIGAGTILVARGEVTGLTTAATIWVVAAIGLAVGAEAYVEAVGTTALVAVTLIILGWLEDFIVARRRAVVVEVTMAPSGKVLEQVYDIFEQHKLRTRPTEVQKMQDEWQAAYELAGPRARRDSALSDLARQEGVNKVTIV